MELRIDKYIKELLFQHNCVIIPAFGGFVGNYKGAEIHPTQHIFTPPCKQIAFNKSLVINDGLLAHYIVQNEKVSYPEALEIIDKEVFKINHLLHSGERVVLNSIGYLKLDVEKNIQFHPGNNLNYELSSFGLHSFQSSAIKRGSYIHEVGKPFKDRPSVKVNKGFKKYRKFALPALILPVALWLFFSPVSSLLKNQVQMQTSGYFSRSNDLLYKASDHQFNLKAASKKTLQFVENYATNDVTEVNDNVAVADTTSVAKPEIHTAIAMETGSYTLIAGCFAIVENAEKQIAQLKSKNIEAAIIGKTKGGLFRVGIGSYNSSAAANEAMLQLKEQQTEVWVLKN